MTNRNGYAVLKRTVTVSARKIRNIYCAKHINYLSKQPHKAELWPRVITQVLFGAYTSLSIKFITKSPPERTGGLS
jgi:hypothetical protein